MGLFGFEKNKENQKNDNIDLAEGLFATLSMSTRSFSEGEKIQIDSILQECETRQEILNKVIELCGEPTTSRQRYLCAQAYAWSKVEFRKLAIVHLESYLNSPIYEDAYKNHHIFGGKRHTLSEEKNIHLSKMYFYLGKAYEGEYEFDKALDCYQKEQSLDPFTPAPFCHICDIMIKQNKLSEAMETYLSAKISPYYEPFKYKDVFGETNIEDDFKKVIDASITELQNKIDKGYVYKPRKNKEIFDTNLK